MRARAILWLALVPLAAGCDMPQPLDTGPDVLVRATEPLYQFRSDGRVAATSCLAPGRSGYGRAPSACVVDNAFAVQVANTNDLVAPRQPGPPSAARPAAAAYGYLYGDGGALGGAVLPTVGGGIGPGGDGAERVDIPAEGTEEGSDAGSEPEIVEPL